MTTNNKTKVAIIGSGNIGSDLMMKIIHHSHDLHLAAMIGVDPASDGLARARQLGVATSHEGIDGLLALPNFAEIRVVFDATSAGAHERHHQALQAHDVVLIDLTPAAIGPYVVPVVNLDEHLGQRNLNMVTCGGQATIPMVAAVAAVTPVLYAEIVASIASDSAGPGTRANIDEFTETTSAALKTVGGAQQGKAIIILNPAEPPLLMRDTVYCLTHSADAAAIEAAILAQVAKVQAYVPGYRLKQAVQFETIDAAQAQYYPYLNGQPGLKVSVFLEVEGAADYLPAYAGNLDIMTSAALACAERVVASKGAHHAA